MKAKTYLFAFLAIILVFEMRCKEDKRKCKIEHNTIVNKDDSIRDDWNTFINALIYVESRGKSNAVSNKGARGVLQEMPILVHDCNRILGHKKYTLNDRLDSLKSVEMFNIIQDYYNHEHDKHLALKIWNGKSKLSYHIAVINKYKELKYGNK